MVELVDSLDSGSSVHCGRAGSSPASPTKTGHLLRCPVFYVKGVFILVNIHTYIQQLIGLLKTKFESRLLYVGLQGSYLRGEATESSDIDIMVVIDALSVNDLTAYRTIIESMDYFDRSCGFICSKTDLENWNPLEINHVLNSTKDYYGVLSDLIPVYTETDIRNFIKMSLNNLYHSLCHGYIHAQRSDFATSLPAIYKGVFFILQNLYALTDGKFISTKAELLSLLEGRNHGVLKRSMELCNGAPCYFDQDFEFLFTWCQDTMRSL